MNNPYNKPMEAVAIEETAEWIYLTDAESEDHGFHFLTWCTEAVGEEVNIKYIRSDIDASQLSALKEQADKLESLLIQCKSVIRDEWFPSYVQHLLVEIEQALTEYRKGQSNE